MQVSGDLSGEEKDERDRERLQGINYRSVIQMRKEGNDSFDVQHAFKAMLKSKAEKVNNMMKYHTKPPLFSVMVQQAQNQVYQAQ